MRPGLDADGRGQAIVFRCDGELALRWVEAGNAVPGPLHVLEEAGSVYYDEVDAAGVVLNGDRVVIAHGLTATIAAYTLDGVLSGEPQPLNTNRSFAYRERASFASSNEVVSSWLQGSADWQARREPCISIWSLP